MYTIHADTVYQVEKLLFDRDYIVSQTQHIGEDGLWHTESRTYHSDYTRDLIKHNLGDLGALSQD